MNYLEFWQNYSQPANSIYNIIKKKFLTYFKHKCTYLGLKRINFADITGSYKFLMIVSVLFNWLSQASQAFSCSIDKIIFDSNE